MPKMTYVLFGIRESDLERARRAVESALAIEMRLHDSSYRGGDYFRAGAPGSENFILQRNYDAIEGEWAEPGFTEFALLLFASETIRAEALKEALAPVAVLLTVREFEEHL